MPLAMFGTVGTMKILKQHEEVNGRSGMVCVGIAACVFNVIFSIFLLVVIVPAIIDVATIRRPPAAVGSGFSTAGFIGLTVGPLCGVFWAIFAILQTIFIAKADAVFLALTGATPLKKLRGVHLGVNIAALVPINLLVFVGVPVTLVKLRRANKERVNGVCALGLSSIALHIFMYVVIGILAGVTIIEETVTANGTFPSPPLPALFTHYWAVFVVFVAWIVIHVLFIIFADNHIRKLIAREEAAMSKNVMSAGGQTEFKSIRN